MIIYYRTSFWKRASRKLIRIITARFGQLLMGMLEPGTIAIGVGNHPPVNCVVTFLDIGFLLPLAFISLRAILRSNSRLIKSFPNSRAARIKTAMAGQDQPRKSISGGPHRENQPGHHNMFITKP